MDKKDIKVGIITIHGICNYGSILQAFALQEIIRTLGSDCKIINYKYPNDYHLNQMRLSKNVYAQQHINIGERIINKIFHYIEKDKFRNIIDNKFAEFRNTYLNLTIPYKTFDSINNCKEFDIYISGSDQIWNPRYCFNDPHYFLSWINDKKKISYASSFGVQEITKNNLSIYNNYLHQYSSISVRELSGIKILDSLGLHNTKLVCDPTLLLKSDDWKKFINKPIVKKKYILCYILSYTYNPYPYVDTFINYVERTSNRKIIFIDGKNINKLKPNRKVYKDVGPIEFLNLVYYCDLMITTSFHGTAFAINFNKPVYSIIENNSNDERITSLLNKVNMNNRLIKIGDKFPEEKELFISQNTDIELQSFRFESLNFLKQALEK